MVQISPLTVETVLEDSKGVIRSCELLGQTPLPDHVVREQLDELAIEEKAERFSVGNHIMIRYTGA